MKSALTLSHNRSHQISIMAKYAGAFFKSIGLILLRVIWSNGLFLLFFVGFAAAVYYLINAVYGTECIDPATRSGAAIYISYKVGKKIRPYWRKFKYKVIVRR